MTSDVIFGAEQLLPSRTHHAKRAFNVSCCLLLDTAAPACSFSKCVGTIHSTSAAILVKKIAFSCLAAYVSMLYQACIPVGDICCHDCRPHRLTAAATTRQTSIVVIAAHS